ncbi:MAG: AraC family ligand binding domain-containing protein [Dehalococcoidales bacterium]|nr:AraC family ligand binding domain-containing protein [Dehalococcoidales bacterium]
MNAIRPYITYAAQPRETQQVGSVVSKSYINEAGQVSFGVIDYVPGWAIPLHHHHTWELILIDSSSAGPGYTFFEGRWWRAEPGSAVFVPRGFPHAWSSGNERGFKMLWVYGGAHEEASRVFDTDPQTFKSITREEERAAPRWSPGAAR